MAMRARAPVTLSKPHRWERFPSNELDRVARNCRRLSRPVRAPWISSLRSRSCGVFYDYHPVVHPAFHTDVTDAEIAGANLGQAGPAVSLNAGRNWC